MNTFFDNLKTQAEENPSMALASGAVLLGGAARLVMAMVSMNNSRAWKKEVNRRSMKDGLK